VSAYLTRFVAAQTQMGDIGSEEFVDDTRNIDTQ
jgi:hypothetical protein